MEVILLERVRNLGDLGEKVKVKNGFARNYLIPYGKATRATKEKIAEFEAHRKELEKKAAEALAVAQERAKAIDAIDVIIINANASDEGKLFGSIGIKEIADAITAKGTAVEKKEIDLPEGVFRSVGEYEVKIQLHSDVSTNIKLNIVAESSESA